MVSMGLLISSTFIDYQDELKTRQCLSSVIKFEKPFDGISQTHTDR
jgi:hypothetical protein